MNFLIIDILKLTIILIKQDYWLKIPNILYRCLTKTILKKKSKTNMQDKNY